MKNITKHLLGITAVVLLVVQVILFAADSSRVVKLEDVPEAAMKTFKKQAGKAKIVEVSKVMEEGKAYYDAKFGTEAKFKTMRVTAADGTLVSRQFYINETPPAVHKAISQQAKGGKLKRIVKVFDADGATFEVKFGKGGKDHEFVLAADGKLISRQMTLRETPKEVQATIKKEVGKGEILQILKTVEDGEVFFQVDVVKANEEQERTMNVAADGTLTSIQVFATELPAKVQATIRTELHGGKVGEIYKTFDDDGTSYELDVVRKDATYSMSVDADGTLIEVELALTDAPASVQKTFKEQLGDAEVEKIVKSISDGGVVYAAEFTKNDKVQALNVAADGKVLDQQMEISLAEAPQAVQKTIKDQAGKGEIESVVRVIADGETVYSVEVSTEQHSFSMTVAEDGKLVTLEEEIPLNQAPPIVQKAITEQLAGAKLESITRTTEDKKVTFDVEASQSGKAISFSVGTDGKLVK